MHHIAREACQATKAGANSHNQQDTLKRMQDLNLLLKLFHAQRWDPESCYTGEAQTCFRM